VADMERPGLPTQISAGAWVRVSDGAAHAEEAASVAGTCSVVTGHCALKVFRGLSMADIAEEI
jgi:hypothetical protein